MMLTNNSLRAFFTHCFRAIFKAETTYHNPIIIVAQMLIKVIEAIGVGIRNRLKINVRIQNPTNKIFDWNLSLLSIINILNPPFL